MDADAFCRADGKPILGHAGWWKIPDWFTADIYQISTDVIIPFSVMFPVGDNQFGEYVLDKSINWGTNLTYVESIKYDDKGKVESYFITNVGEITLEVALNMAKSGHLDNVVVVTNRKGKNYLRTKRNVTTLRNLT